MKPSEIPGIVSLRRNLIDHFVQKIDSSVRTSAGWLAYGHELSITFKDNEYEDWRYVDADVEAVFRQAGWETERYHEDGYAGITFHLPHQYVTMCYEIMRGDGTIST